MPIIERATRQTGQDVWGVYGRLLSGKAQLVVATSRGGIAAAMVTELQVIEGEQVCNIWIVAGRDMEQWIDDLDGLEDWARSKGCVAIQSTNARLGWARKLKPRGYNVSRVTVRKEL